MNQPDTLEVEVYPIFNRRTGSGFPLRYRWRTPHNGRTKSYPTKDAAIAAVGQLFDGFINITEQEHVRK